LDITDHQLAAVKEWAATDPRIIEVRLFGSRARGTSRPDSDVDLAFTVISDSYETITSIHFYNHENW